MITNFEISRSLEHVFRQLICPMSVDSHLSVSEAYTKYLVWKPKPGQVFEFSSDKRWYWVKKPGTKETEYIVAEYKSVDAQKNVTLLPKGSAEVSLRLFISFVCCLHT